VLPNCSIAATIALPVLVWLSSGADLDEAEKWAKEFLRCKRDLDELVRRKEEHDKLLQVVELMKEKGIDIAIITRGNE
jgi:phosphoserine phosphatase